MKYGNFEPFCTDCGQAGIGIAQQQERIRFYFAQEHVCFYDDVGDGLCDRRACGLQEEVGFPDLEIFEKYLIELVIVVLAGMDQRLFHLAIKDGDRPG